MECKSLHNLGYDLLNRHTMMVELIAGPLQLCEDKKKAVGRQITHIHIGWKQYGCSAQCRHAMYYLIAPRPPRQC